MDMDTGAIRGVARRYTDGAADIAAAAGALPPFRPADAGQGYAVQGNAIQDGIANVAGCLRAWAAAAAGCGAELGRNADEYDRVDRNNQAAIGAVGAGEW